jgi:hypothetical protein
VWGVGVQDFMDVDRRKEECVIEPEFIRVGHPHSCLIYAHALISSTPQVASHMHIT